MRDNRVPAVDYHRIIPPFVEHAEVHSQHRRVEHIPAHRALVRADDHQMVAVGLYVRLVVEQRFENLIIRYHVVKPHKGHCVLNPRIMRVKRNEVGHAHVPKLLQRDRAIQRFPVAAAVLPAAVQHRHDYVDAVRLAAGSLDNPSNPESGRRGHRVLARTSCRCNCNCHVHQNIQIVPADTERIIPFASPDAKREHSASTRKVSAGLSLFAAHPTRCPSIFAAPAALSCNQFKRRDCFFLIKNYFTGFFVRQSKLPLFAMITIKLYHK